MSGGKFLSAFIILLGLSATVQADVAPEMRGMYTGSWQAVGYLSGETIKSKASLTLGFTASTASLTVNGSTFTGPAENVGPYLFFQVSNSTQHFAGRLLIKGKSPKLSAAGVGTEMLLGYPFISDMKIKLKKLP